LMTLRRQGFSKVYDLAERVLPPATDTTMPSPREYGRFLVRRFLQANGLGRPEEIAYQRNGAKRLVEGCAAHMAQRGDILPVQVRGRLYYALPGALQLLGRRWARKRLKILSPFDNLLIQRRRMRDLFDFDYRVECYTPARNRKHGYFSLPLLWDGRLVARMDCKAERPNRALLVRNFVGESLLTKKEDLVDALVGELIHFARFNACRQVKVGALRDKTVQTLLRRALAQSAD